MASSLEALLINSYRCQGSKRDHFGKKLMRHFLAGSFSVVDSLQKCSPFSTLCVSNPFAMQLCSSSHWQVESPPLESGSALWLLLANRRWKWHCVSFPGLGLNCTVCFYSSSWFSTFARRAQSSLLDGRIGNRAESAQMYQVTSHI